MERAPSLMSNCEVCWFCKRTPVCLHHIYEGNGRRQICDREGAWVFLCPHHHNTSNNGVHFNKGMDLILKRECQKRWMIANKATVEDFIKVFGRNYL